MKKRILFFVFVLSIPVFLFLQVVSAYQYSKLEQQVSELEQEQKEWFEKNKKLVAGISVLKAPERIEKIAQTELGLKRITSERVTRLLVQKSD